MSGKIQGWVEEGEGGREGGGREGEREGQRNVGEERYRKQSSKL